MCVCGRWEVHRLYAAYSLQTLYCTVLYCTVLCCAVHYYAVLYCTLLCCTVLYCTVLYFTVCWQISSFYWEKKKSHHLTAVTESVYRNKYILKGEFFLFFVFVFLLLSDKLVLIWTYDFAVSVCQTHLSLLFFESQRMYPCWENEELIL